jgi:hypothetical protein
MRSQTGPSLTDDNLSFAAAEFVWNSSDSTEAHQLVAPPVIRILRKPKATTVIDLGCGNSALTLRFLHIYFIRGVCWTDAPDIFTVA